MNGLYPGDQAAFTLPRFDHLPENQRPVFHARFLSVRQEHERGRLVARDLEHAERLTSQPDNDERAKIVEDRLENLAALLDLCLAEVQHVPDCKTPADLIDHLTYADLIAVYHQTIQATAFTDDLAKNSESPSSSSEGGSATDAPPTDEKPTATAASTPPPPPSPPSSSA
ncbi:MAG: hypothetical protein AAGI54_00695 [Planctomycetota bacterium]